MWFYAIVSVGSIYVINRFKNRQYKPLELLKNALLTHALTRVCKDDFDDVNCDYAVFDGSKLPGLSGCDDVNAYFSYGTTHMMDSQQSVDKVKAIQKYLDKNLKTDKDVEGFFKRFISD